MKIKPLFLFAPATFLFFNAAESSENDISQYLTTNISYEFSQKAPVPEIPKHDQESRYPFVFKGTNKGGYVGWFRIRWDDYPSGKKNEVDSPNRAINESWSAHSSCKR